MQGYPFNSSFWRQARWWLRQWRRVPERWRHRVYAGLAGGLLAEASDAVSPANPTPESPEHWLFYWHVHGREVGSLEADPEQRGAAGVLGCLAAAMDFEVSGRVFDDPGLGGRSVHADDLALGVPGAVVRDVVGGESARRAHVAPLCPY